MSCCCEKHTYRKEADKDALKIRINKIAGQMNGIKKMIDDDRYCSDILIQLLAIEKAIKSLEMVILDNHLKTCVVNDIKNNDLSSLDEITDLIKNMD